MAAGLFRAHHRRRLGGHEIAGIGLARPLEDLGHGTLLDDAAVAHDADPVGELPDHPEIVGDEQDRHAELALQLLQELQDLRLHGDIEGRRRLVGDQQVRLVGERHGDHHALALATRKLVRIAVEARFRVGNPDLAEEIDGASPGRDFGEAAMQPQHLRHLLAHRVQRVERGHRLLEHDGDVVAANRAHLRFRRLQQVLALEQDLSRGMRGRRIGQQLHHRQRRDRLSRTGFADQRDGLAAGDVEGDVVDREALLAALAKGDGEISDGEERRSGRFCHGSAVRKRSTSTMLSGSMK
jgi:hypothetical protein